MLANREMKDAGYSGERVPLMASATTPTPDNHHHAGEGHHNQEESHPTNTAERRAGGAALRPRTTLITYAKKANNNNQPNTLSARAMNIKTPCFSPHRRCDGGRRVCQRTRELYHT